MKKPKHLIIMSTFNGKRYIKQCLNSLIKTTNLETNKIVIVDDNSRDSTRQILKIFRKKHPQITFIFNRKNISKPKNINLILRQFSNFDYYTILDQDVIIYTKNWSKLLFEAHRDFHNKAILGVFTHERGFPFIKNGRHYLDPYPFWTLAGRFFSFHKTIFKKLGYLFDKSYRHEDREYCFRAYIAGFHWYYNTDIKARTFIHPLTPARRRQLAKGRKEEKIIQRKRNDYLMLTHKIYYQPNWQEYPKIF